ncbi:MAG: CocE/NonD family hydrolase [Terracidiphilus sp.]
MKSIVRAVAMPAGIVILGIGLLEAQKAAESDALDAQLHEKILMIPGDAADPALLQVTLFKPDGEGPFPLAVLNHGKSVGDPRQQERYRSVYEARYFVSRGYIVVLPMLRGFAGSGGVFGASGCDAERDGLHEAKDIRAVIEFMARQPNIDPSRIVVSGQSYGGWNTLALGTLNIPGVKGLVNFAGGRKAPDCSFWETDLADAAGRYGKRTRIPSIWFYGDNDETFSAATWREMYRRYTAAGGTAELVAYGKFLKDSHNFLGSVEALPIWMPKLDAFLKSVGLPGENLHPELLPPPYPEPTGFASIDDVNAVPFIGDKGREDYRAYLSEEMPRAFVIGLDGTTVSSHGGYDPLSRALGLCEKNKRTCHPYAVDDQVVWVAPAPTPIPPPTHFASIDDTSAIPFLNEYGRQSYSKFLALENPRAFVMAIDGTSATSHGGFDPLGRALELCQQNGRKCTPYAVNDEVVWVTPIPPATHFADIHDVSAVPVSSYGSYQQFLGWAKPRAFVIASDGTTISSRKPFDPLGEALKQCQQIHRMCRPYAVDDDVVWVKPMEIPHATRFAEIDDVSAVPYLGESGRKLYRMFLAFNGHRAFAISPDGACAFSRDFDPLASALDSCGKQHQGCQLYAVDDQVVWSTVANTR